MPIILTYSVFLRRVFSLHLQQTHLHKAIHYFLTYKLRSKSHLSFPILHNDQSTFTFALWTAHSFPFDFSRSRRLRTWKCSCHCRRTSRSSLNLRIWGRNKPGSHLSKGILRMDTSKFRINFDGIKLFWKQGQRKIRVCRRMSSREFRIFLGGYGGFVFVGRMLSLCIRWRMAQWIHL